MQLGGVLAAGLLTSALLPPLFLLVISGPEVTGLLVKLLDNLGQSRRGESQCDPSSSMPFTRLPPASFERNCGNSAGPLHHNT